MLRLWFFSLLSLVVLFTLSWCGSKENNSDNTTQTDNIAQKEQIEQQLEDLEVQKVDLNLPSWVEDLDISEPQWMNINKDSSYQTTEKIEWFNSIHYVYNWDYDTAMQQAEIIADQADIPLSPEFKMAQEMIEKVWEENIQMKELVNDLKWIIYTNYSLTQGTSDNKYLIAITVDESWSLELDVTDREKMEEIGQKYTE